MQRLAAVPACRKAAPGTIAPTGLRFPHGEEVGASLRERLETVSAAMKVAHRAAPIDSDRARREILWCREELKRIDAGLREDRNKAPICELLERLHAEMKSLVFGFLVPSRIRRGA